jgi:hypothetical protein
MSRHAFAIYRITVDEGGKVSSWKPFVLLNERLMLAPFEGRVLEGKIARRDVSGQDSYELETALPIRLRIEGVVGSQEAWENLPEDMEPLSLRLVVENLDTSVTASDGTCMALLRSHGDADPFAGAGEISIVGRRHPSMHTFGDDEFVFEYFEDGVTKGSVMDRAWFVAPGAVIGAKPALSETYSGTGHGTPGAIPNIDLKLAEGGGGACTAP